MQRDADAVAALVRRLGASVNVSVLGALINARKTSDGWLFLSELAEQVDQAPGTVSVAVQKLLPDLVEEKYDRGRRYFRARIKGLRFILDDA